MITDRSQTQTTKSDYIRCYLLKFLIKLYFVDRVASTKAIVTRVLNHSLKRKKRSNYVIHVKIRSLSKLQPTDNNLVRVIRSTEHHHGRSNPIKLFIDTVYKN